MAKISAAAALVAALTAGGAVVAAAATGASRGDVSATTFVRACGTDVYGDLGPARRWQRNSVIVGPFAFAWIRGARTATRRDIVRAYRSGQGAYKALAVLQLGRTVTVSVPANERRHVALLYDVSAFDRSQTVAHGEQAVTFRACSRPVDSTAKGWAAATQFNGGIIVDAPRCVRLVVRVENGPKRLIASPFGPASCR